MDKKVSIIIPTMNRMDDVTSCVKSVLGSTYKNFEIIVIDNASKDDTAEKLKKLSSKENRIKIIESDVNLGAAGGRNKGASYAKGEYLLFVDCDNVIDKRMISHLVKFLETKEDCGMVGPLMLIKKKPKIIWIYFADINMYSSQAKYKGTGEKDEGQYDEVIKVGHLPNCFMIKKEDFFKINGFDEKYIIMFEEADLAEKIKKKLKKNIYLYTKAKTYHNIDLPKTNEKSFGFRSKERAFLTARNRIYFMKKNTTMIQWLTFFFIFNPLIFFFYIFNLIKNNETKKAIEYIKGSAKGLLM